MKSNGGMGRVTATKHMDSLAAGGFLQKQRIGRVCVRISVCEAVWILAEA